MPLKLYRRPGSRVWHFRGTVGPTGNKQRLRGSTNTEDKDTAAREVANIEKRYWDGHHNGAASILTFDQACTQFTADGKSISVGSLNVVEAARKHFKDKPVSEITGKVVRAMAQQLYGHCTGASKNRMAITPVASVINHCAELDLCAPIKVKRFPEQHKEKDPADLQWVQAFMAHASPHLGAYALFMFLTGARPSEALAIDPNKDLNLQKAEVTIRMTKVEKEKTVAVLRTAHLPPDLVAVLGNLDGLPGRPLFIYRTYGDMIETWRAVIRRAGIANLTPHCCRHGFATELLRRGVDVHTVAWLGGWASAKQVLETYGHAIKRRDLTNVLTDTLLTQATEDAVPNVRNVS